MSLLVSDLNLKLPQSLKAEQKFQGGIVGRSTQVYTTQNDRYSPNGVSQITATINPGCFFDAPSVYWRGYLEFTKGLRLTKSIHSLFRRIQVRAGSEIIMDTDGANVLQAVLNDTTLNDDESNHTFAITTLTGSDAYREQIYSGVQFAFVPNLAILRQNKLLPGHYIGELSFTFFLESTDTAFVKVNPALTSYGYQISNFETVVDICSVSPVVESLYQNEYETKGLQFALQNWRMSPFQNDAAVSNLKIDAVGNSNKAIVIVPRLVSRLLQPDVDSFQRTFQTLKYVQFMIGSNLLSRYACFGGGAQLMQEIQKTVHMSNNSSITPYNFHCALTGLTAEQEALKSSKALIMQNLDLSRGDDSILSGTSRVPITLSLEYSDLIQPTSYYVYVLTDTLMTCSQREGTRILG